MHARAVAFGLEIEARFDLHATAGHASLPAVSRAHRPLHLLARHFYLCRAANVRNANLDLDREMVRVLHAHALKIGKQWAEALRVREEIKDLFRLALYREITGEGDGHAQAPAAAAAEIALMMFWYPVQRQVLPAMALRISASLGRGVFVSNWQAESIMPGVQYPHCS